MSPAAVPAQHVAARIQRIEFGVYSGINRARARRGLPTLSVDWRLMRVSMRHSRDMAVHRELSHSSSDGTPFYRRVGRATNARLIGETIAAFGGGRPSAGTIVRAWLRSPVHRAELLDGHFRRMGIGIAASRGLTIATADFASG
jgi:uncharacterized protein YkwD